MLLFLLLHLWFGLDTTQATFQRKISLSDEIILSYLSDVVVSEKDSFIVVLDSMGKQIIMISPDGSLVTKFGQEGQGPGEFVYPASLHLGDNGLLYVADVPSQKILVYQISGEYHSEMRLPGYPAARLVSLDENHLLVTHQKSFGGMKGTHANIAEPLFTLMNDRGEKQAQFMRETRDTTPYVDALHGDVFLFPVDGNVIVVPTVTQNIRVIENFKQVKVANLPLDFVPVKPQAKMKEKNGIPVVHPTVDYLVQDAVMAPNGSICLLVNREGTSKNFQSPQRLLFLDPKTLQFTDGPIFNQHIDFLNFLSKDTILTVEMTVEGDYDFKVFKVNL